MLFRSVRVVAATNRDLEKAVDEGVFRKDLYFRLHVVELLVPPLREHEADIPALARYFLERFASKTGRNVRDFTPAALDKLSAYDWPGNIRQLRNTVERMLVVKGAPEDILRLCTHYEDGPSEFSVGQ